MQLATILLSASVLVAQVPDTLQGVTVVADKGVVVSRTDTVSIQSFYDVTDVIQRIPGLALGDYGGAAGLKSVSLRGLGTAHTAIYVDGVRVGNVQSGQADLGFLDLTGFGSAIVDYAQNSLSFKSARPVFADGPVSGQVSMRGGSFGTYLPSARLDFRLSDNVSLRASASGVVSEGNYPYGDGLTRANNDISQLRAGLDLFGNFSTADWHVKAYYNTADRGTPGSSAYPSEDRQNDENAFIQGVLDKRFSSLYTMNLSAKAAYDKIFYQSAWGDSDYRQKEIQLNTSHGFRVNDWWKLSAAASFQWDGLSSTVYDASRTSVLVAASTAIRLDRFKADIAVEYDGSFDKDGLSRNSFSPSADLRFTVAEGLDIVGFGRRAYRVPTFNELYYVGYGNPDLKPEDAWLTDLGIEWHGDLAKGWQLSAKVDGFYNSLTDKITSAPSPDDPYVWMPYNIGKVEAKGVDISAGVRHSGGLVDAGLNARYSRQDAIDKTPDSYTYGQQIAYVAKHTANINADAAVKGWRLDLCWNLRSGRYDSYGEMPSWNTVDLTLSKSFRLGNICRLVANISAKNLADCRYEMVRDYPMPGRSIIGGLSFSF